MNRSFVYRLCCLFGLLTFGLGTLGHAQTVKWNAAVDGIWSDATKWDNGVPTTTDAVVIDAASGTDYFVTLNTNATVDSLAIASPSAVFQMSGRTFTTTSGASNSGKISMFDSIWNTGGTIANSGTFRIHSLTSNSNNSTINGDFANSGLGILEFNATGSNAALTINGNASNAGAVNFLNNNSRASIFTINNTTQYTNTGTIKAFAATSGAAANSYIRTNSFGNSNQVINESGATMIFDQAGAAYVNSGTFSGTNGGFAFSSLTSFDNTVTGNMQATLLSYDGLGTGASTMTNSGTITSNSGDITFQQLTLTNTGTIQGTGSSGLNFTTVDYVHNGGISGFGGVNVSASNLTLNADLTNDGTATFSNSIFSGSSDIINGTNGVLTLIETTVGGGFVNNGIAKQSAINLDLNNYLNGGLTNNASALIEIGTNGSSTVDGILNVDGNINNSGTIDLVSSSTSSSRFPNSFLVQTNGTLTNNSDGLIESKKGQYAAFFGNYLRTDDLVNNGILRNSGANNFYFDRDNADYVNNGNIQGNNGNFWFDDVNSFTNSTTGMITGGNFYVYGMTPTTSTFSNAGTFNLTSGGLSIRDLLTADNSGTIDVSGGNVTVQAFGTFNNSGAIQSAATRSVFFIGGNYNHQTGASITGGETLSFNGTTLNLTPDFTTDFNNLEMLNSTVNGPGKFVNAATTTMTMSGSTFTTELVNNGIAKQSAINLDLNNYLNGGLTNNASALIEIGTNGSSTVDGILNVDGNINNSGTIDLVSSSTSGSRYPNSFLVQTNGTLTNNSDGLIESKKGQYAAFFGNYLRTDDLVNNGTIRNSGANFFYFDRDNADYVNNGNIQGNDGNFWFDDVNSFTNSATGTITGGNFYVYGMTPTTSTFSNAGTFNLTTGLLSIRDLLTADNSGTIDVSGGNVTAQAFGTFNNSGAIQSAATRSVFFIGGNYNHQTGASITGGETLSFNGTTLNLTPDFTTDFNNLEMLNSTVNGPGKFVNAATTTMTMSGSTFTTELVNNGIAKQSATTADVNNYLNGGLTNNANALIEIGTNGTSTVDGILNVDGNINNSGTIDLVSSSTSGSRFPQSFLVQTNGTLTNNSDGLIESKKGQHAAFFGNFLRTDDLVNNGILRNSGANYFYFDRDNADYVNNGNIQGNDGNFWFDDVNSFTNSATGTITGGNFYVYGMTPTTSTFSNAGTFNLTTGLLSIRDLLTADNSGTIDVSGGNVTAQAFGTFNNSGAIQSAATRSVFFIGGNYNHQTGASITGGETLSFNGTTLNLTPDFTTDFNNLEMLNSTVNGPGKFVNAATTTMTMSGSTFTTELVNNGIAKQSATTADVNNYLNGGLTNNANALIEIGTNGSSTVDGILNVDGNINNSGTIDLVSSSTSGSRFPQSFLVQTNGTLTNNSDGLIESKKGQHAVFFGNFLRTDDLVNNGTIRNSGTNNLYLDRAGATYLNNGTIDAAASHIRFTSMTSFTNSASGTLSASGGNIYLDGPVFTNSGTITGNNAFVFSGGASLENSGLISPGASPGMLTISGDATFLSASTLLIELGGTNQGVDYDFLNVTGTLALDGILDIDLWNGYVPLATDTFTILAANSVTGMFDNGMSTVSFEAGTFDVTYNSGNVMLSNFTAVPEPGALLALIGIAGVAIGRRRRRV